MQQSWIQPLYCLHAIAYHRLANPSELDPLKKEVEDRYFRSRKDFTRIRSQILFNLRSDLLHKSLITPIYPSTVKLLKMTLLLSNWTVHSDHIKQRCTTCMFATIKYIPWIGFYRKTMLHKWMGTFKTRRFVPNQNIKT